jgi:predicted XRE-type DNA-binding protein
MAVEIEHITPNDGNIFADLGLPDAEQHQRKAALTAFIQMAIAKDGLSQREAAGRMGLKQPKLSNILRGHFSGISEDKLMNCLACLGYDIELQVKPRHAGMGQITVLEAA